MIALIDYGSGNLRSVQNALRHEGADPVLISNASGLHEAEADAVVLPGVGAFGDCVDGLRSRGLWEPLQEWLSSGKPFLGICVGYQLLFDESEESPRAAGFGVFAGRVKRFSTPGVKVPQIGWNRLQLTSPPHLLWSGLPSNPHVYFVHSYFPDPQDQSIVAARTEYGEVFAAAVARGNIAGVQFHPEKSQEVGLAILRNFLNASRGALAV
jgi:glutamine amidotransferase